MSDGEGVASAKCKAQAQILDMLQTDSQTLDQVKVTEKERRKNKVTVTQGGT